MPKLDVKQTFSVRQLVNLAMLAAVSILLVALIRFPIFPSASFLEYDFADIPILIGTFLYGPLAGLALTAVVSVLQGVTVSAQSGFLGIIMHFFATGAFVLVAGLIYSRKRTRKTAALALILGAVTMTAVMIPLNLLISPVLSQMTADNMPAEVAQGIIREAIIPIFVPFNAIKACVNGLMTFAVYKAVAGYMRLEGEKTAAKDT